MTEPIFGGYIEEEQIKILRKQTFTNGAAKRHLPHSPFDKIIINCNDNINKSTTDYNLVVLTLFVRFKKVHNLSKKCHERNNKTDGIINNTHLVSNLNNFKNITGEWRNRCSIEYHKKGLFFECDDNSTMEGACAQISQQFSKKTTETLNDNKSNNVEISPENNTSIQFFFKGGCFSIVKTKNMLTALQILEEEYKKAVEIKTKSDQLLENESILALCDHIGKQYNAIKQHVLLMFILFIVMQLRNVATIM